MTVLTIDPRVSFQTDLAALPGIAGLARHFLTQLLDLWGIDGESTDTALLLVSELATNAAKASGRVTGVPTPLTGETVSTVIVRVRVSASDLRVEVWDNSPALPTVTHADGDSEGGRGMWLVDELSDEWGCEPSSARPQKFPGKTVWFQLKLPQLPQPRSARRADAVSSADVMVTANRLDRSQQGAGPKNPQPAAPLPQRRADAGPSPHPREVAGPSRYATS